MTPAPARRWLMPMTAMVAVFVMVTAVAVGLGSRGTSAHEGEAHPAHLHTGTCATLGDVVFPLNDVGGGMMDGTPVASIPMGPETAVPVDVSVTTVQADLATIIDGGHALNVHESAENIGNYIACGDVGGAVVGSDLAIGLATLNDSGYSGAAWLHDNGDGTTMVTVFLTEAAAHEEGEEAETEASPVADDGASADAVAVEIVEFAYSPDPVEVAVGTTVTWTNQDSAPHTATGDGGSFNTDRLDQGASGSFTFDTAGEFAYHCEFHPNMSGTVVVQ